MLPWQQPDVITYSHHLITSFRHWTGRDLIPSGSAEELYHAPFVLVSHGIQPDPIFCYANLAAQKLWNMDWDAFIKLPSRLSAETDAREERQRLLQLAEKQGFVGDYRGVRIASDGRRFRIHDCFLWNVINETGDKIGQAAKFDAWEFL